MSFESAVHRKAIELGKLSLEMTTAAGSGHPSSALSLAHLVTVLMYHQMHWDPKDPWNPLSDRLVLSEGHAVPIIYAALADLGAMIVPLGKSREQGRPMTREDAMSLRAIGSPIDGHPNPRVGVPFFDAATAQAFAEAHGMFSTISFQFKPTRCRTTETQRSFSEPRQRSPGCGQPVFLRASPTRAI